MVQQSTFRKLLRCMDCGRTGRWGGGPRCPDCIDAWQIEMAEKYGLQEDDR